MEQKKSLRTALVKILAVIGAITLFFILLIVVIASIARATRPGIPSRTVLEIDFGRGMVETYPETGIAGFALGEMLRIRDIVTGLDAAAQDRRVRGLVARISGGPFSYGDVQEVRDAVMRFRASGKPAVAFAETFGEMGPGNSLYYLSSAFDSIFLQPSGDLGITGLLSESAFFSGTLEKLNIRPQLGAREEYKTARNIFTERKFTRAHREMNRTLIDSIFSRMVRDIAAVRPVSVDSLRMLFEAGPYTAVEAREAGLVDGLLYRDGVYDNVRRSAGENVRFLYLSRYIRRLRPSRPRGNAVALIYGEGTITRGRSRYNPLTGDVVMGSETIAAAFRAAVRDREVGAIVFRINSPGGSYVGSDVIWREVVRAREAGKPVIATMGAVAGSGGYFVAMNADRIVAQPSTLTGSIGVVAGKLATEKFFNRLGVTYDRVATSPNATLWSPVQEFTPRQWERLQSWLDTVYVDFVTKVAQGRNLTHDQAASLAKGRVYTGTEALTLGLVDTLGGFPAAFAFAKQRMGIPVEQPVRVKRFPRPRTLLEQFLERGPDSSEEAGMDGPSAEDALQDLSLKGLAGMVGELLDRGLLHMRVPSVF